jgi:transcriptional regulator with XRE-family HTH domain
VLGELQTGIDRILNNTPYGYFISFLFPGVICKMILGYILVDSMDTTNKKYDFSNIGKAIKTAREARRMPRSEVSKIVDLDPRYIMSVENKGQHPSFQKFYELVTLFNVSVDRFFYPDSNSGSSDRRRQIEAALDDLDEKDLVVLESTISGLLEAKRVEERER